jgi:hypothetical protein
MEETAFLHLQWQKSLKSGLTTLVRKIKVVSAWMPPGGACGM